MSRVAPEATTVKSSAPAVGRMAAPQASDVVHYPVKWIIDENGQNRPICTQNNNGPCPLLALANATLLMGETRLEPGTTRIREDVLMGLLADYVSSHPSVPTPDRKISSNEQQQQPPQPQPHPQQQQAEAQAEQQRQQQRQQQQQQQKQQQAAAREYAVNDFLDLLPRLNRGMDVNVRFSTPLSFEFTRELSVFDVFPTVRLVHGWLVDPQDVRLTVAIANLSYNQLLDELVRTEEPTPVLADGGQAVATAPPPEAFYDYPDHPDHQDPAAHATVADDTDYPDFPAHADHADHAAGAPAGEVDGDDGPGGQTEGAQPALTDMSSESPETANIREMRPLIVDFLECNSTQLTVYGLQQLHEMLREKETAILFRNSHFYVMRKHGGEIYTLVTDEGFLNELNTVWEKLTDVTGDSTFYTGAFERISDSGQVIPRARPRPRGGGAAGSGSVRTAQGSPPNRAGVSAGAGAGASAGASSKKKIGKNVCAMQ